MALTDVLVHTGTPLRMVEDPGAPPVWIEGERGAQGPEPVELESFRCVLFLPVGTEEPNPFRPRQVSRPTLLYEPVDVAGGAVRLGADDDLLVAAPELAAWTGAARARWQVAGEPQPFGPPGEVIGVQAILVQVRD